jgi:hypothetical protein
MSQELVDIEDLFFLEHVVEGASQLVRQRRQGFGFAQTAR